MKDCPVCGYRRFKGYCRICGNTDTKGIGGNVEYLEGSIYKIQKDFYQQIMYIIGLACLFFIFYPSFFLWPFETPDFYIYNVLTVLVFVIIIALFIVSIFHFKSRKVEINFDKDLRTITIINPFQNNKILSKIDFSCVKSVVYYRDLWSRYFARYHLVIKLKLLRNIKIFDVSNGDCLFHGLTISKITKKPIKFKLNFKYQILMTTMVTFLLISSIFYGNLVGLIFSILLLIIMAGFLLAFKEKKEENQILKIHNQLQKIEQS